MACERGSTQGEVVLNGKKGIPSPSLGEPHSQESYARDATYVDGYNLMFHYSHT
jgi:hypothetical protein